MLPKYEYSTHSSTSSKGSADAGGLFAQADTNQDGVIDRDEFQNLIGSSSRRAEETSGSHGSALYESTSFSSGGGIVDAGLVGRRGRSSYKSSGYSSGNGLSSRYQSLSYESTSGVDASAINQAASYTVDTNPAWSKYGVEVRGAGLYFDPNPEIIRKEAVVSTQSYKQNIRVHFLQPPPVPASGTLIIKEVRERQPAALPPLRIRQEESVVTQLPPLILRERPPEPPVSLPSETIIRHLPALPPPPRSVIIERIPAAPAPPRDIIIERWLPYTTVAERKTIVQRAEEAEGYAPPRNIIIQHDVAQVRIVREFKHMGVTQADPQAYLARFGAELLDTETLLRQARAAGVIEDISISAANIVSSSRAVSLRSDTSLNAGGEAGLVHGTGLGGASSLYSYSTYKSSSAGEAGSPVNTGFEYSAAKKVGSTEGSGDGFSSATYKYQSSSYSSGGAVSSDVASTGFSSTDVKL